MFKRIRLPLMGFLWVVGVCWAQESFAEPQALRLGRDSSGFQHRSKDIAAVESLIRLSRNKHRYDHDLSKEHQLAEQAVDLAQQLNDTLLYARALDNLGLLYRYHHWYAQAIQLHTTAYELVENKAGASSYRMIFANNAGVAARYGQQYDLAIDYYLKALRLATAENDLKNIAISSNGLGNALSNLPEKEEEALAYFEKALEAELARNDSLGIAMDLLSLSDYYMKKGKYDRAKGYLDRLMDINTKRKDSFGIALANEYYGHLSYRQGTAFPEVNKYYERALRQYVRVNNEPKTAEMLYHLGNLHLREGNQGKAGRYYRQSYEKAELLDNKLLLMNTAFQISKVEELAGRYQAALKFFRLGKAFEDSINIAKQKIQVAALHSQYNLEKKESEIALLQKEQDLKQEKIASQQEEIRVHRIYSAILLLAALFAFVLIYVQQKSKRAKREVQRKLLRVEYERNLAQAEMLVSRMQINPHFIFNCLNAIKLLIQKKDYKKAMHYLTTFSRFIRMVLEMPKSGSISLAEELDLVRYYLVLEEKRFSGDFVSSIKVDTKCNLAAIKIPPLLLQPFIENAIWHGLLPSTKPEKRLNVLVSCEDGRTKIRIEDNGVGRSKAETSGLNKCGKKSMGMAITKERIQQFNENFNCHLTLEVLDKDNSGGTEILLTLEQINEETIQKRKLLT